MAVEPTTGIGYDRAGPRGGVPVVLLHAGVMDRQMWQPQWSALTREHDTLRLDLRGFGESSTRPDGLLDHREDVVRTLAALEVHHAHVVGCSLGAGVAVEFALEHADTVASLFLLSPGGALIAAMTPELREFVQAEDVALERGDLDAAVQANLDWWVDGPHRGADVERAMIRYQVAPMQRRAFELTAGWDDHEDELDPPALDRLGEIRAPTLVLAGGLDLDAIIAAAELLVGGIPDARHELWPDVAHLPSLERPDDVAGLILSWVDEVEAT